MNAPISTIALAKAEAKAPANDNGVAINSRNVVSFGQHRVFRNLPRYLKATSL